MKELTGTDIEMLRKLAMIHDHFPSLDYEFRILEAKFIDNYTYNGTKLKDRNEFDHLIKGDLEEYRNPIIYPSEYEGKKVYGMNDWHGDFSECFCPGDLFTVEIAEHFLECVPPKAYSQTYVQCGEPYSHVDAGGKTLATYTTFEAVKGTFNDIDSVWRYCGHCFSHEREEYKGE